MKYYLLCLAALLLCMALGALIVFPLLRGKRGLRGKLLLSAVVGLLLVGTAGFVFLSIYYHAGPEAEASLASDTAVSISGIDKGSFFDGPGTDAALIFYPGAKVEAEAYAPLMRKLAAGGLDCFLADMPLRMAVLDMEAAGAIRDANDYDVWLLAGHSLGGAVAANYASARPDDFDALVLLAAYPSGPLPESLRLLSVYGSEDGCLNREQYEAGRAFWPADARELIVEGGNHAQFGAYGPQCGDGAGGISADEQQTQTADAILALLG